MNYYLENKSSYIARSSEALNVSENYVSVRRNRIFSLLPRLMEMTRNEYLKYCYESNDNALASSMNKSIVIKHLDLHNPIVPALDIDRMVEMLIMAL